MKKLMLSVFALAAVVLSANAQNTATKSGVSRAKLQAPITVSAATTGEADLAGTSVLNGNVLDFGTINIVSAGGDVKVSKTNAWSTSTAMTKVSGSTASAAGFKIVGETGLHYTVSFSNITDLVNGTTHLTLSGLESSAPGVVDATNNVFLVGGTLTIPEDASVGTYTDGSFDVTVAYN